VIDVNVPKHLTDLEETHEHAEEIDGKKNIDETQLLAKYLWDNYIE